MQAKSVRSRRCTPWINCRLLTGDLVNLQLIWILTMFCQQSRRLPTDATQWPAPIRRLTRGWRTKGNRLNRTSVFYMQKRCEWDPLTSIWLKTILSFSESDEERLREWSRVMHIGVMHGESCTNWNQSLGHCLRLSLPAAVKRNAECSEFAVAFL